MECATCRFAEPRKFGTTVVVQPNWSTHECRFHAPVAGVDSDGNEICPWPLVNGTDWCGDWFARRAQPKQGKEGEQ